MDFITNRIKYLYILLLLILGLVCGLFISDIPYLTFKRELSLGEIANFTLTLFIAIYIPFFLNKKINNKRIEKDILIQACDKINNELSELQKLIEPFYVSQKAITKDLSTIILLRTRRISNMLDRLINNTTQYKNNKAVKDITDTLVKNQTSYWSDLTLNVKDRRSKITQEVYLRTENNFKEYEGNISKLIMHINGA